MSSDRKYPHYDGDGFQAVELQLRDSRIGMYVFLPDEDSSLPEFLSRINAYDWERWMSGLRFTHNCIQGLPAAELDRFSDICWTLIGLPVPHGSVIPAEPAPCSLKEGTL